MTHEELVEKVAQEIEKTHILISVGMGVDAARAALAVVYTELQTVTEEMGEQAANVEPNQDEWGWWNEASDSDVWRVMLAASPLNPETK